MDCSYADYVAAMELTYTQSKTATKLRRRLRTIFCGDLHLLVGKREKKCPSLAHFFFFLALANNQNLKMICPTCQLTTVAGRRFACGVARERVDMCIAQLR